MRVGLAPSRRPRLAGRAAAWVELYGDVGDYVASGLDGAEVHVYGDAQDQVGQIFKDGELVIHGDVGQTLLYAYGVVRHLIYAFALLTYLGTGMVFPTWWDALVFGSVMLAYALKSDVG